MTFDLPMIGSFDAAPDPGGYWRFDTALAGVPLSVDLNVDDDTLTAADVAVAAPFLARLAELDAQARAAMRDPELDEDGAVEMYVGHHLEDLGDDELAGVFGTADRAAIDRARFLAALRLRRVGFHPRDADAPALFDYTIGDELTDYVISLSWDSSERIVVIAMES